MNFLTNRKKHLLSKCQGTWNNGKILWLGVVALVKSREVIVKPCQTTTKRHSNLESTMSSKGDRDQVKFSKSRFKESPGPPISNLKPKCGEAHSIDVNTNVPITTAAKVSRMTSFLQRKRLEKPSFLGQLTGNTHIVWHCCVLWDSRVKKTLEEHHFKWKDLMCSKWKVGRMLTKYVVERSPNMALDNEPNMLLKVVSNCYYREDNKCRLIVVELATADNHQLPEAERQYNLIIDSNDKYNCLLQELTRLPESPTLVMVWGYTLRKFTKTLKDPTSGQTIVGNIYFQQFQPLVPANESTPQTPTILIYHQEEIAQERISRIREVNKFNCSELKHFGNFGVERMVATTTTRECRSKHNDDGFVAVHFTLPFQDPTGNDLVTLKTRKDSDIISVLKIEGAEDDSDEYYSMEEEIAGVKEIVANNDESMMEEHRRTDNSSSITTWKAETNHVDIAEDKQEDEMHLSDCDIDLLHSQELLLDNLESHNDNNSIPLPTEAAEGGDTNTVASKTKPSTSTSSEYNYSQLINDL